MEIFLTLDTTEKTIAVPGDRRGPKKAKQERDNICKNFLCNIWEKNVTSAQILELSLLGIGTVRRLERDAWSMVE